MQLFLNSFSSTINKNEHVLLILDGSKAHDNNKIIISKNITLHFLPTYSPQLNPIERVLLFLKRNYLCVCHKVQERRKAQAQTVK